MNDQLINRYSGFFSKRGDKFTVYNNVLFVLYNGMVVSFVPTCEEI